MDINNLKLYNKYKDINLPDREFIFIGYIYNINCYCFLIENKILNTPFSSLKNNGFDPDKIVKELNLEIYFNKNGFKYIKGYYLCFFTKQSVEKHFKPLLKDKLYNILNR